MLDTSPMNLHLEVQAAERRRDDHLAAFEDQVRKFHGPHWDRMTGSGRGLDYNPENHAFNFIQRMLPMIAFGQPTVKVTSRRGIYQVETAKAIQSALRSWMKSSGLMPELQKTIMDMLFCYGVMLVQQVPNEITNGMAGVPDEVRRRLIGSLAINASMGDEDYRMEEQPLWPKATRISPRDFVWDHRARSFETARYAGHTFRRDQSDLLRMAETLPEQGWDAEAISNLAVDTGHSVDMNRDDHGSSPPRHEVKLYEIWVPEHELDDSPGAEEGFHGTIFTIAATPSPDTETESGGAVHVRAPRPYYGPKRGPYAFFGVYGVPDSAYPLSPLIAVEQQTRDLNAMSKANLASAKSYRRGFVYDQRNKEAALRLKNIPHDGAVGVPGFDKAGIAPFELGGVTQQGLGQEEYLRDRLERQSGISDAMRGNVTGEGTATENQIANEANKTIVSFIQLRVQTATKALLNSVGWYMYHDDSVLFPGGEEMQQELMLDPTQIPWFQGGDFDLDSGATFEDLGLDIEPMSMQRPDEATRAAQVQGMTAYATQMAMAISANPMLAMVLNVKKVTAAMGEVLSIQDAQDWINPDPALMMLLAQPVQTPAPSNPEMSKQSSAGPPQIGPGAGAPSGAAGGGFRGGNGPGQGPQMGDGGGFSPSKSGLN